MSETEEDALQALGVRFLAALAAKDRGQIDAAEDELRAILRIEPRLAEPRLELARILLDTDRLPEADDHAREALEVLEGGGQWVEDVPGPVLLAMAHALLAEVVRRKADEDDVIFGDPAAFRAMIDEAKRHFARAAELDPSEEYASYYAVFLGDGSDAPAPLPGPSGPSGRSD